MFILYRPFLRILYRYENSIFSYRIFKKIVLHYGIPTLSLNLRGEFMSDSNNKTTKKVMPTKQALNTLVKELKRYMLENPDLFWDVETEQYETTLTIGFDGLTKTYGFQIGDNSYSGGAYGYPYWAVVMITNNLSNRDIVDCIVNQFHDIMNQ